VACGKRLESEELWSPSNQIENTATAHEEALTFYFFKWKKEKII